MARQDTPQNRYELKHAYTVSVKLIDNTEQELIDKLKSVPNKAGYIKQLIRADIQKSK